MIELMGQYNLNEDDASQVRAILLTHAEMSDQSAIKSSELKGRIERDCPEEEEMIEDLGEQIQDFEEDRDNLKRIANIFGNEQS